MVVNMVSKVIVSTEKFNWAFGDDIYPSSSHENSEIKITATANI